MAENNKIALAVDLDGTLIATDTLLESTLAAIKLKPYIFFLLPFWILRGKSFFKNKIARITIPDPANLPYRQDLLNYIKEEKSKGREIALASATVKEIAESVASYLGVFDRVLGSEGNHNLRSSNKLEALEKIYGKKGFDYAGNSGADLKVWQGANKAVLVNTTKNLKRRAARVAEIAETFDYPANKVKMLIREIRIYQWVKNVLIFLPLLMAHMFFENGLYLRAIAAFFAFSFTASFVYVINDMMDLEADRLHPRKKKRPLASGALSIPAAAVTAVLLLTGGVLISLLTLPPSFSVTLLIYFVLTTAYSFGLKKLYILDIFILASLYTLRLIAGGYAVQVKISPWLLALSMFIFLSLAMVKRYTELRVMMKQNKTKTRGRGYIVDDAQLLMSIGPASGYIAALVLTLYLNSNEVIVLYKRPEMLWPVVICLLMWITRIWFLAHRGKMTDDPIVFTVKDYVSYILGLIVIILAFGANL